MTYEEANAALHALRDAGYEVSLCGLADSLCVVLFDEDGCHDLTQSEIDKMIMEAEDGKD